MKKIPQLDIPPHALYTWARFSNGRTGVKTIQNRYWTIICIFLLSLGGIWIWITRADPAEAMQYRISAPQVGLQASDFTLSTLSGEEVQLSDFRGSAVLINFWASWCPPCRAEMADMQRVYDRYERQGFTIFAVNLTHRDSQRDVKRFVENQGLTFPILLDISGNVGDQYQVRLLPTSFFINRDGVIQKIVIGGPMRDPIIDRYVKPILGERE